MPSSPSALSPASLRIEAYRHKLARVAETLFLISLTITAAFALFVIFALATYAALEQAANQGEEKTPGGG
jgi:hypothetical protein